MLQNLTARPGNVQHTGLSHATIGGCAGSLVVGPGGAGKSTFARRLGERTGLPVIHLDEHYWRPGWEPTPDDEWREPS